MGIAKTNFPKFAMPIHLQRNRKHKYENCYDGKR